MSFMHISPKFKTYLISLETWGSPRKSKNQVKNQVGLVRLGSMPHNHNACASITLSLPMLPVSLHSQKKEKEKKKFVTADTTSRPLVATTNAL